MTIDAATAYTPEPTGRITRIGIVGAGEVVRQRYCPAIAELRSAGCRIDEVIACGLEPRNPLGDLVDTYYQIDEPGLLPMDRLRRGGAISEDVLWIVATPPDSHAYYAIQLAGKCRVGIEKPLADSARRARLLLPFVNGRSGLSPIDQKLFNPSPLELVDRCRGNNKTLDRVAFIRGQFFERDGFSHGRQQADVVYDVQWHPCVILAACFRAAGEPFQIVVEESQVARHAPDLRFAAPSVWTASRLCGRVLLKGRQIPFDLRQAKGAPYDEKGIDFMSLAGEVVCAIDLSESGHQAHRRVIYALMQSEVDMRHSLQDAINTTRWLDQARAMAEEGAAYRLGNLPDFIPEADRRLRWVG